MSDIRIRAHRKAIRAVLPLLKEIRDGLIESHSLIDRTLRPIPGTIDGNVESEVREYDRIIGLCNEALRMRP